MPQHRRAPACRREQGALHIPLDATVRIGIAVEQQHIRVFHLRFLVFHIDLSRQRLVAIFYARRPFAHLDALHPRARCVVQPERLSKVAQGGDIFGQQLDVGAGQSEEFNLPRTGRGVVVVHIHRRVVHETLSEVAAGGAQEFVSGDGFVVLRQSEGVKEPFAFRCHRCCAQFHGRWSRFRRSVGEGVAHFAVRTRGQSVGQSRRCGRGEKEKQQLRSSVSHVVKCWRSARRGRSRMRGLWCKGTRFFAEGGYKISVLSYSIPLFVLCRPLIAFAAPLFSRSAHLCITYI